MSNNTQTMTDEEKRAKKLEQLAQAREKALAKRRAIGELNRQEKQAKEELLNERIKKMEMLKASKQQEEEEEEVQKAPKGRKNAPTKQGKGKVVKKVIEVSDSSSDDETSSESDDEPQVEYIVRRTKKAPKAAINPKGKKPTSYEEYDTPQLSAEVAKSVLKKRVMDDAQSIAFKSLFPYHNF